MSLPNCEKDYNESNKNMQVTYYPGTSTSYQFKIFNCKIGGIYKILICYNYNLNGSKKYRGCITAFLSIACGYNGSKVVVRPKLDVLVSYTDSNFDTTNQLTTLLQGAVSELEAVEFETNPHVFLNLNYKTGAAVSDINIKVVEEL